MLPDPHGQGLLVFAYRDLFRVDLALTRWQYLGPVAPRYTWGRPDAMASTTWTGWRCRQVGKSWLSGRTRRGMASS